MLTLAFSAATFSLVGLLAYLNPQGTPDDAKYSAYLKDNFKSEILQGVARPNKRHYFMPDNLTAAGAQYAELKKQQTDLQNRYNGGAHTASIATKDAANAHSLADVREVFRKGLDGTGDGSVVLTAIECSEASHAATDTTKTYRCNLTRAEVGGFDDTKDGIDACSNTHDYFDVVINTRTNGIEELHSKGAGLVSPINFDADKTKQDVGELLFRNFAAYATDDMVYFTKLKKPKERDAFLTFSACLTNGPKQ